MVLSYDKIGEMIVEDEQGGKEKAKYCEEVLKELSAKLTGEFGKGFSVQNLERMKNFYLCYSISQTVSVKSDNYKKSSTLSVKFNLSWSHYIFLIRLEEQERSFCEIKATQNNWSVRELERPFICKNKNILFLLHSPFRLPECRIYQRKN